jgi:predicted ATP-dependent endonuclease of OLD family
MHLLKIEFERYRSVKSQKGEDSIEFDGLDCLVGKNNAGKTNILSAVKFVLGKEEKELNEELFWKKQLDEPV